MSISFSQNNIAVVKQHPNSHLSLSTKTSFQNNRTVSHNLCFCYKAEQRITQTVHVHDASPAIVKHISAALSSLEVIHKPWRFICILVFVPGITHGEKTCSLIIGILPLCTSAHLTVLSLFNPTLNLTFSLQPITSSHPHASASDSTFDYWRYINIWWTLTVERRVVLTAEFTAKTWQQIY